MISPSEPQQTRRHQGKQRKRCQRTIPQRKIISKRIFNWTKTIMLYRIDMEFKNKIKITKNRISTKLMSSHSRKRKINLKAINT
jgi:hypothetical protein